MAQFDPREQFQRIQKSLQNSSRGFGGGGANGPAGRGFSLLIGLGILAAAGSNALFTGWCFTK